MKERREKNKETCNSVSSNCVVWQGPNIPCLSLCKGDSVSDVIYKAATELCNILQELDPTTYNLDCLEITCQPDTFRGLIQTLIERVCSISAQDGANGNYVEVESILPGLVCPNGGIQVTLYNGQTQAEISTWTICNGNDGDDGDDAEPGAQGPAGNYITVENATVEECPEGGYTIVLHNGTTGEEISRSPICFCSCTPIFEQRTVYTTGEIDLAGMSDEITGETEGEWYSPYDSSSISLVNKANLFYTAPETGVYRIHFEIRELAPQASENYLFIALGYNGTPPVFPTDVLHPGTAYIKNNNFDGFTLYGDPGLGNTHGFHTFIANLNASDTFKVFFYNALGSFFIDANPLMRLIIEKIG